MNVSETDKKRKKLLITGCGRSGTQYIAALLRENGLIIEHEYDKEGIDGITSWILAVSDDHPPFGPSRNEFQFDTIIHQVRNPLDVIASVQTFTPESWEYIKKHIPIHENDSLLVCAMKYWYYWNILAEQGSQFTYRIEDIDSALPRILDVAHAGIFHPESLQNVPKNINTREHGIITLDDLKTADPILFEQIIFLAEKYGYHFDNNSSKDREGRAIESNTRSVHRSNKRNMPFIVFISHYAEMMGAERSLLDLIDGLEQRGVLCHVVIPVHGPMEDELKKRATPYTLLPYRWWIINGSETREQVEDEINEQAIALASLLDEMNPDIVYTNTSVISVGALAAKILGKPHVWHVREFGELDYNFNFTLPIRERSKFVYEHSEQVIYNSKAVETYYAGDPVKSTVVYNNVGIDRTISDADLEKLEKIFKNKESYKIAILGSVIAGKKQEDVILALKDLIIKGISAELVIVGGCEPVYGEKLKQIIHNNELEDHVHFLGYISKPYSLLQEVDVVVVCSKIEAFGRTIIEGMLAKKPIIATQSGGVPEIITDGVNGLLYTPGDYRTLAGKLEFLFRNPNTAALYAKNGYKFAHEHFSDDQYSGKISAMVDTVGSVVSTAFHTLYTKLWKSRQSVVDKSKILDGQLKQCNQEYYRARGENQAISQQLFDEREYFSKESRAVREYHATQIQEQQQRFFEENKILQKELISTVGKISEQNVLLQDHIRMIDTLTNLTKEQISLLQEKDQIIYGLQGSIKGKDAGLKIFAEQVTLLEQKVAEKEIDIARFEASKFWKLRGVYMNSKWAVTHPLKFTKKHFISFLPDYSQISWALGNPAKFVNKYALNNHEWKKIAYLYTDARRHYRNEGFWKTSKRIRNYIFTGRGTLANSSYKSPSHSNPDLLAQQSNYFDVVFDQTKKNNTLAYEKHPEIHPTVQAIAFYLPQFHPIPENDQWWGNGFTEWTNVSKAIPQFLGHHQPMLPGELGFYDLRNIEVQKRQIELAKNYGLYGFCYHYYWFSGKKLLDRPLEQVLAHPELDFPFCINWANENWSRRWDGEEHDVLMRQEYKKEDAELFIKEVSRLFKDKRYIRIEGKPVLLVHYPAHIPDPKSTAVVWRKYCRDAGIGEIYLVASHAMTMIDPRDIGYDAAVEFSPNQSGVGTINEKITSFNKDYKGTVYDYNQLESLAHQFQEPPYKKFRGICPSWDNEARKPGSGTTFIHENPETYGRWFKTICDYSIKHFPQGERLIFINAWNEWAEGAVLEPTRKYGCAYLEETYKVLSQYQRDVSSQKIIYVGHDAAFNGAQFLSLSILRELKERFKFDIHLILKSGGVLEDEYKKYATVYNLSGSYQTDDEKRSLIQKLKAQGCAHAIANTVISGDIVGLLYDEGIKTISLIHELPGVIDQYGAMEYAKTIAQKADHVIFPSSFVGDRFCKIAPMSAGKKSVRPQGLLRKNLYIDDKFTARKLLRKNLGLKHNAIIILAVAYADHRKGIDLFFDVASKNKDSNVHFVWVGNIASDMQDIVDRQFKKSTNVHLIGTTPEISMFYAGADAYLMTSREDPFPSTVLESMSVGVPVVGFHDAGGFIDIVTEKTGILVPYLDTIAMAEALEFLLHDGKTRKELGEASRKLVREKFVFKDYVYHLLEILGIEYKKVSVIVPNYNYAHYIQERLRSIIDQTYPLYELVVLDDRSPDDSVGKIQEYMGTVSCDSTLEVNQKNSGSVFSQWMKGVDISRGDFVWIAEADDLSLPTFLEHVMKGFDDDRVVLSYTQSKMIDQNGQHVGADYLEYTNDIDREKWKKNYIRPGKDELIDSLVIKNVIPNVSAVVFRKSCLDNIPEDLLTFKVAGDWFLYSWILSQGGYIAYISQSLNVHRRHDTSVSGIGGTKAQLHFDEIKRVQDYVVKKVNPSQEIIQKINAYRIKVKEYLGITTV